MKEFLSQKGVAFVEYDVTVDGAARNRLVSELNSRSTPTTVVDGQIVIGFDRNRLNELLAD